MPDTPLKNVMTPDPVWISPHEMLRTAAQRMKALNIGFLVVYDVPTGVVGVITDRDITVRAVAEGLDPASTQVREAMTTHVASCYDDDDLEDAAWLMERKAVRRLVVLNRAHELVGVLSLDDVARALGAERLAGHVLHHTSTPI
jgi:CBS domain-containing protein